MTTTHKFSMRKTELLVLVIAALVASCSYYQYEKQDQEEAVSVSYSQAKKVGKAPDFTRFDDVSEKKQAFFDYLRPGIELENQRVKKERSRLDIIQRRFKKGQLTAKDRQYASELGERYNVQLPEGGIDQAWLETMLHRVDVLPESLVLVQAANESAWGTSRFARKANNYFGQWCYSEGCGVVPLKRGDDMSHEVAKFKSVQQSIHGYFMNVNRNHAYEDLREIRYQRHVKDKSLTDTEAAIALTNGLLRYSERGEDYVKDIKTMIMHNQDFWEDNLTKQ